MQRTTPPPQPFLPAIFYRVCLFTLLSILASCNGQPPKTPEQQLELIGKPASGLDKNTDDIFQDQHGNYWFADNGAGVYWYNGKKLLHITDKEGLCSNFVWSVQEDVNGHIWFTTRDGICRFDGAVITNYTDTIKNAPTGTLHYTQGGLFFGHLNGMCFYNGNTFTNFTIHPDNYIPDPTTMNRPYAVYSTLVDKAGNLWFGTQERGVCRYNGKSFTFFADKGLDAAAVRTIFEDKAGNIWFGNNGAGLFRYSGDTLVNVTEEKGLANPDFLKSLTEKAGTLARVFAVNQDNNGNLWVGTIDSGAWQYSGNQLTNYTTQHGLTGNAIWKIYKNQQGELMFINNGEAIYRFTGAAFTKMVF